MVAQSSSAAAGEVAPGSEAPDAEIILSRLQTLLENQAAAVRRRGVDFLIAEYNEAQFVMAALADDIFLYDVEWAGRDAWNVSILEYRLFRSRIAGNKFFTNINILLQSRDAKRLDLATIYLLALHLGFKGQYREGDGDPAIAEYLQRLYQFIYGRTAKRDEEGRVVIPQAYGQTIVGGRGRLYRLHFDWRWLLALVVGCELLASVVVWSAATGGLDDAVDAVFQAASRSR
jgi:type VI secretion system protein ImpK